MNQYYRFFILTVLIIAGIGFVQAQPKLTFAHIGEREELMYDIYYNWGVIWKKAGKGHFVFESSTYNGKPAKKVSLYGRTLSIVETFFPVRDTLLSYIQNDGYIPKFYTKIINEGGYKATDEIKYEYPGDSIVTKVREIRSDNEVRDTILKSKEPIFDMLTVFYYLRSIELQKARVNDLFPAVVVTGRHLYKLKFKFLGMEEMKIHKKGNKRLCYKVQLVFENSHGQIDDDSMIVYVSDDESRVPVQLEAKLRIGYMKAILQE